MDSFRYLLAVFLLFSNSVVADTYPAQLRYRGYDLPFTTFTYLDIYSACQSYEQWVINTYGAARYCGQMRIQGLTSGGLPQCQHYVKESWAPYNCVWGNTAGIDSQLTCPYGGTISGANCINAPSCATGEIRNAATGACELPSKSNGGSGCNGSLNVGQPIDVGNPINAGTGNKWQHEIDLAGGASGLKFDRYYNASKTNNSSDLGS